MFTSILHTASAAVGSVHDLTEKTDAVWLFYVVIAGLLAIIGWFAVKDRNDIARALDNLTREFANFRHDMMKHYASKEDLHRLEMKLDRHIDHSIPRGERRTVEDAET